MVKKKSESTKRFGPRYGRRLKEKVAEIEAGYRKKNKCPYCGKINVKRVALGIWFCKSCNSKFTGKAYSLSKKTLTKPINVKPKKKIEKESSEEEIQEEVKDGKV